MKYLSLVAIAVLISFATVPNWSATPEFMDCTPYSAAKGECDDCRSVNADLCADWVTQQCIAQTRQVCAGQSDHNFDRCEQQVRQKDCLAIELNICEAQLKADFVTCNGAKNRALSPEYLRPWS